MNAEKPLLTLMQVRDWQDRIDRLAEEIRVKTAELESLTRTLNAAKAFMALLPDDELVSMEAKGTVDAFDGDNESIVSRAEREEDHTGGDATPEDSISACILSAVGSLGGQPKASAIRTWIANNNPAVDAKLLANPSYLYTALTRHVRGGRIAKRGKRYRLPTSSSKGEAGGVAPPASNFTTNSVSAVADGTEGGGT